MKRAVFCLIVLLALALPMAAQPAPEEMAATAMSQTAFKLTPAQPSVSRTLVVDATDAVSVAVTAASQTLEVRLTAPNGTHYFVGDAPTAAFESGFFPIDAPSTKDGATYLATVKTPQAGTWTLRVTEPSTLAAPMNVVVRTLFGNDVRAMIAGGGDTYPLGSPVRLAVVVFDGSAKVRPLTVTARLFRSGSGVAPASVAFTDDGTGADTVANDGIYEGFANAPSAGLWQVQADISGTASTGAFVRTAAARFTAVARRATISNVFTDRGIDLNGDALLDQIGVTPRATLTESGVYNVGVRLRGSNGSEIFKTVERTFTAGSVAPEVIFATSDVARELGVDGPYAVAEVRFLFLAGSDLVPADIRYDLGNTAAYLLNNFQRPRLRLTGRGTAVGVDFNANGRFDQLNITLEVAADFAGTYQYSARLSDVNGQELGFRSGSRFLSAGINQIPFSFAGFPIGQNGVDGPYFLSNLLLFGGGRSLVADTAFVAEPFLASQFEGYVLDNTPPVLSVSVTPSVLYPPNHQMVEITPTISVSDDRDPDPRVDLVSITSNEGDDVRGDGNTSPDITIDPTGRIFLRAERSGLAEGRIYTITWRARDDSGNTSTASATVTVPHDQRK
ncbi:MAG TPA: choice-of-anchor X domain-containing protein [Thermoanaerobaculia bacterium]|nr:choice-of-anchor X domain-containing protein [Thermoanaerobaculia bacterium]